MAGSSQITVIARILGKWSRNLLTLFLWMVTLRKLSTLYLVDFLLFQHSFEFSLPEKFYAPLMKLCTTMNSLMKSIKIDDIEIIETAMIYSRVIAVQLTNDTFNMRDVLKYELSPIPTSMFNDSGDIRTPKNEADLKNAFSVISCARV